MAFLYEPFEVDTSFLPKLYQKFEVLSHHSNNRIWCVYIYFTGKKGSSFFSKPQEIQRDDVGIYGEKASPVVSTWYEISSPWSDWLRSPQNSPDINWLSCSSHKRLNPGRHHLLLDPSDDYKHFSWLSILRRGKVAYALTHKLLMQHANFLIVINRIK